MHGHPGLAARTAVVVAAFAVATAVPVEGLGRANISSDQSQQRLVFDAVFSKYRFADRAPQGDSPGDAQHVNGILRDAAGRSVGHFAFTCVWKTVLAKDVLEQCSGSGRTADGRLEFAGPAHRIARRQTFRLTGRSGRYAGIRGELSAIDIGTSDSVIVITAISARAPLRIGVVPQPPVNTGFVSRADSECKRATAELAKLPLFPYEKFDPLHPDPALLPKVGSFLTGRGDPRPTLRALQRRLVALGNPPANRPAWVNLLHARQAVIAVADEQDRAALAGDVKTFIRTFKSSDGSYRSTLIAADAFGSEQCGF